MQRMVLGWHPGPAPSARSPQELRPTTWGPLPQVLFSLCLSVSFSVSLSFHLPLSTSLWLTSLPLSPACWLSFSLSEYLSISLYLSLALSLSLSSSSSESLPQSGTHSSWGYQVGQAHMLLAQQAPPGTGRAGRQLQGLRSEWLLLPVLHACQVHLNHRDLWPPLQMRPAGGGFHLTVAGKRTFSHTEGPFTWQTLFLDPWSPSIPLTSLEVITSPLLVI